MRIGRSCRCAAAIALVFGAPAASAAASLDSLLRAYPDALAGFDGSSLIWRDGTRMPVGDEWSHRSMEEQLRNGTILDQLRLAYPAGAPILPAPQQDPGRIRNRAFFDKMYGDCKAGEVAPKLVQVVWLPNTWGHVVRITAVNGVDRQLAAISSELDAMPAANRKYLYPLGGTYACRPIADTGQTSMHAWGAAIDINPALSDYWLWHRTAGGVTTYVNRIPPEVVAVFERHGFIWGGRWAHFDTMHFEYRPELLNDHPKGEGQYGVLNRTEVLPVLCSSVRFDRARAVPQRARTQSRSANPPSRALRSDRGPGADLAAWLPGALAGEPELVPAAADASGTPDEQCRY